MSDSSPTARSSAPPPLPRRGARGRPPRRRFRFFSRFHNALLGWEVLRAGRRTGTLAIARVALGGLLLAAMWALYSATYTGGAIESGSGTEIGKRLNRFAESFAVTFFIVQATAVLLLTPVFVAGAIFEERETRSGEILLTTELTRREVYVGKLGGRMVQVLLVVLAGMPILFLTQLWGGVSMAMILVDYTATMIAVIGAGVVTAAVSAYAESLRAAILRSYGLLFLLDALFFPASPYFPILMASLHWGAGAGMLIIYIPLQLVIVLVGYFIGQRWLRMAMLRQKTRLPTRPGRQRQSRIEEPERKLPPLDDSTDPLLWKELNASGRVTLGQGLRALLPDQPTAEDRLDEMGLTRWFATSREVLPSALRIMTLVLGLLLAVLALVNIIPGNWMARNFGGLALCWLICAVGLTAATGISRERQKQTLIDMLMLPGPRRDLLRAKALGALARGLWPAVFLGLILILMAAGLGVSLIAVVLLAVMAVGLALFSAAIGVWLSARSRNALHSTSTWIGVMAGIVIGTFLLAEANVEMVKDPGQPTRPDYPAWTRVVNPLLAWGRLAFKYDYKAGQYVADKMDGTFPIEFGDVAPALLCPILYAGIGALLWWMAVRRFEKEGRS